MDYISKPSIVWYDLETTGTDTRFDRPAQFACVETDMDLNIINDPVNLFCKPSPGVLFDPIASLVTRITPQMCNDQGLIEYEFASQVLRQFMRPGTCGAGYNSMKFDDEMLRHLFYRNLLPPYDREWKDGSSRFDLFHTVMLFCGLGLEGIKYPTVHGKLSLKLEHLIRANGLEVEGGRAHEAVNDVYSTIALARLIRDNQPDFWRQQFTQRFKANLDWTYIYSNHAPFVHASPVHGAENRFISLLMPLGLVPGDRNSLYCVDLRKNIDALFNYSIDELKSQIFCVADTRQFEVPLVKIALNKAPAIAPVSALSDEAAKNANINLADCRLRYKRVLAHVGDLLKTAKSIYAFDGHGDLDAEAQLYDAFIESIDTQKSTVLHRDIARNEVRGLPVFVDRRLNKLMKRLAFRTPALAGHLTEADIANQHEYLHMRLHTSALGGETTVTGILRKCEDLLISGLLSDEDQRIVLAVQQHALNEARAWTQRRAASAR